MMFELLLKVMERTCEIPTLNAPSPCCLDHESHRAPGRFFGDGCPRHFVPGYDRIVPPGHFETSLQRATRLISWEAFDPPLHSLRFSSRPSEALTPYSSPDLFITTPPGVRIATRSFCSGEEDVKPVSGPNAGSRQRFGPIQKAGKRWLSLPSRKVAPG